MCANWLAVEFLKVAVVPVQQQCIVVFRGLNGAKARRLVFRWVLGPSYGQLTVADAVLEAAAGLKHAVGKHTASSTL